MSETLLGVAQSKIGDICLYAWTRRTCHLFDLAILCSLGGPQLNLANDILSLLPMVI